MIVRFILNIDQYEAMVNLIESAQERNSKYPQRWIYCPACRHDYPIGLTIKARLDRTRGSTTVRTWATAGGNVYKLAAMPGRRYSLTFLGRRHRLNRDWRKSWTLGPLLEGARYQYIKTSEKSLYPWETTT
jgi:hypothetical protein